MPRRASRYGGSPVTSSPAYRTLPALGLRKPEITENSVVLPAPFGPISAVIRPASADTEAALTASKPPNRRDTPSTESSGSATGRLPDRRAQFGAAQQISARVGEGTEEAARREADDQHEHRTVDHQIEPGRVAGHKLDAFAHELHDERASQGAEHRADAADDRREQSFDRDPGAIGDAGIDKQKILHIETAGGRGDGRRHHHRRKLDRKGIDAERHGGVLV